MIRWPILATAMAMATLVCMDKAGAQQYPILDSVANRVVQKYQQSSCEQLWQRRHEPRSQMD